jgi:glyoxylase-like metal-dependent hydrolase (beta-lactamase superfamily II)
MECGGPGVEWPAPKGRTQETEKGFSEVLMRKGGLLHMLAALLGLLLVGAAPAWAAGNGGAKKSTAPLYKVYAIRYGTVKDFPLDGLVKGAPKGQHIDIAMMFWLLQGGERNILVDAGFFHEQFIKSWKPVDYVRPSVAIGRLGLKPEDITDIIVSHAHWDHMDGVALFPRARVWIQKAEFDYYSIPAHQKHTGVFPVDMAELDRLKAEHRLELVDGDNREILPGIRVYTGGRHTYASQYVGVETRKGTVIVASDNVYLYENLEKNLPIAETFDAAANLRAQHRMEKLASSPNLIIPGHDPEVFIKFPKPGDGVARIA